MIVILKSLRGQNWKGSADETVSFDRKITKIFGRNGAGKSRQFEEWIWLLTGKDSNDKKDYDIKNNSNKLLWKQDHIVTGEMDVNSIPWVLKRLYKEKHEKTKGEPLPVFTGHETKFWKNDVPFNQTQYQELIRSIAPENVIKLVSNPLYFNNLKWQEQRDILIQMAGEITEEEVLNYTQLKMGNIDKLIELLEMGYTIDELKAKVSSSKKLLSEELEGIQPEINGVLSQRPTETEGEFIAYESALNILISRDQKLVTEMTEVQNEGAEEIRKYFEKENEITNLRAQANQFFINKKREYKTVFDNKASEKSQIEGKISRAKQSILSDERLIDYQEKQKKNLQSEIDTAKAEFNSIRESVFVFDKTPYMGATCPTCGQTLKNGHSEEHLAEISATKEATFNTDKAANQAKARQKAIDKNDSMKPINALIVGYKEHIEETKAEIETFQKELEAVEVANMPTDEEIKAEIQALPELTELLEKAELLTSILPEKPQPVDNSEKKKQRAEIEEEKSKFLKLIARKEAQKKADDRVKELEAREIDLSQQIADIENRLFLIEGYTSSKIALVEERVNNMFTDGISFKLFTEQVNGAIVPDCVAWYHDPIRKENKPWQSLSTGQEIWVGMACIKTFCRHYDIYLPIWIHNRDLVTDVPEMESQVISMYVSPQDDKLRVVHG